MVISSRTYFRLIDDLGDDINSSAPAPFYTKIADFKHFTACLNRGFAQKDLGGVNIS